MIQAKAFRKFIKNYSLFKSGRLSANIKLILNVALIRSLMIYACPAWELGADAYILKLQRLKNKILHNIINLPRCTLVREDVA
jgi:hypothetical protein